MQKLNLVTVTGSRTNTLNQMLNHYNDLVDEIHIVVYQWLGYSTLGEVMDITSQFPKAKIVKIVTEPKFNWNRVTELYNEIKQTKPDEWWVVSDDDEFHIYPKPIKELISECEQKDWDFITGGFIDRIGENGEFPIVEKDSNIWEKFPLAGFFRYPMSGACPNKVCIMKGYVDVTSGQHYAIVEDNKTSWGTSHPRRYPIGRGEGMIQVHHFKWDSTCCDRIKEVANIQKDYAFSTEYEKMYLGIKENDFKINIHNSKFLIERMTPTKSNFFDYTYWNRLSKTISRI